MRLSARGPPLLAADAPAEVARRLAEAPFEAAGEIELVAEGELVGDLLDAVASLVEQGGGAIDPGLEMKLARCDAHGRPEFLARPVLSAANQKLLDEINGLMSIYRESELQTMDQSMRDRLTAAAQGKISIPDAPAPGPG